MPAGTSGTLSWSWSHEGGATQIQLDGEFDLVVAAKLGDVFEPALAAETVAVRIDFANVTFMDSTGLRFLLETKRSLDDRQIDLMVCNPSPIVRRVIDVSGLTGFFGLDRDAHDNVTELFDATG